jgi:L-lysine 2,3-aminomutase
MARQPKPENETPEQAQERRLLEKIANTATRSEKTSWKRKRDNIEKEIEKLAPIESQIQELMAAKLPIVDKIAELRTEMVETCVHPFDLLVEHDGVVKCKFCERRFTVPEHDSES